MAKRKLPSPAVDAAPAGKDVEVQVSEIVPVRDHAYTVVARRYRPQQFADLVGQEPVVRALVNALESNRVAHAYLFTGARGVGKTTTARLLAKALNCIHGPTATPCDACEICQGIAAGEDVDVLEIDGASNRGIDEVREIRQNVQYRPGRARYKIYIVDEVHMLTPPAFNALLKTLEEPPAHVKFIFATTEVQRIPVTILSRCQRFDFAGIGTARIVARLRQIVAREGLQADDDALELLARRAGGSMRDAQSLLDQLLAFGGDRLTRDQVHSLLGTAQDDRVAALAAAVLEHEPKRSLELLAQAVDEGAQLGELLDQLIEYWRDLMVVKCAGTSGPDLGVSAGQQETLRQQAEALGLDTVLAGLDILETTKARLRNSSHARILLEMALVRLGRLDDLVALAELRQWLGDKEGGAPKAPPRPSVPPSSPPAMPPEAGKKKSPPATNAAALPRALTPASVAEVWAEVLRQAPPMLASELEKAEIPAISGPNTLVLRFPMGYNSQREHCQEPARVARIEELLGKLTGRAWNLRIESVGGSAAALPAQAADEMANSPSRYRRQRAEAVQEPLVKRALEVLGAQIVHVDEGFGAAPTAVPERAETADGEEA
jgi:DNA polymerase-3 subunit gamma/tau